MKQIVLLFFCFFYCNNQLLSQDCGCMQQLNSVLLLSEFEPKILEDSTDFEKGKLILQAEKESFQKGNLYHLYIINRTDSTFYYDIQSRKHNIYVTSEAQDSLGVWRPISYMTSNACYANTKTQVVKPNEYIHTIEGRMFRRNRNFATNIRYKVEFKNQEPLYTEIFSDTISYCRFIGNRLRVFYKATDYDTKTLLSLSDDCFEWLTKGENRYRINIITKQFIDKEEYRIPMRLYHSLQPIDSGHYAVDNAYERVNLAYGIFNTKNPCLHNYESVLAKYLIFWIRLEALEKVLEFPIDEGRAIFDKETYRKVKEHIEVIKPQLPTKAELETTNYQEFIEIIDGEMYFKIDCFYGKLVKVHTKD